MGLRELRYPFTCCLDHVQSYLNLFENNITDRPKSQPHYWLDDLLKIIEFGITLPGPAILLKENVSTHR